MDGSSQGREVIYRSRRRHAVLRELVSRCGSACAAAMAVQVPYPVFVDWMNLRDYPKLNSPNSRFADENERMRIESKFIELTGMGLEELWPEAARTKQFPESPKEVEKTKTLEEAWREEGPGSSNLLVCSACECAETQEHRELLERTVRDLLRFLPFRSREVLRLRYGIGNSHDPHTLEECGRKLHVTRERIRQLEYVALRKLRFHIQKRPELQEVLDVVEVC